MSPVHTYKKTYRGVLEVELSLQDGLADFFGLCERAVKQRRQRHRENLQIAERGPRRAHRRPQLALHVVLNVRAVVEKLVRRVLRRYVPQHVPRNDGVRIVVPVSIEFECQD